MYHIYVKITTKERKNMKTQIKKTFAILLSVLMLFTVAPLTVFADDEPAVIASGYLKRDATVNGERVTWTITDDRVLTIDGNGSIPNYWENFSTPSPTGRAPYYDYKKQFDTVVIKEGITGIGTGAFTDYTNIKQVTYSKDCIPEDENAERPTVFADNITSIGYGAFKGCSGLDGTLTLSNSLTAIGNKAFRGCCNLKGSLVIPDSVVTINDYAFCDCVGFDGTLTLGNSVEYIGEFAFGGYSSGNVHWMHFKGDLNIPNSVKTIGYYAFAFNGDMRGTLNLGNSVEVIDDYAFYYCVHFTGNIVLPNSVKSVGEYSFAQFSQNVLETDENGDLVLDDNGKPIPVEGFNGTITLNEGLETVGASAFNALYNVKGNIYIPASVKSIGSFAFARCSSLDGKLIFADRNAVEVADCAFHGSASNNSMKAFYIDYPEFICLTPIVYDENEYYHGETLDGDHPYYEVCCADCNEYIKYEIITSSFVPVVHVTAPSTFSVNVGETKKMGINAVPTNATNRNLLCTSSDTTVATVNNDGYVTGLKEGTATITVSATDGSGKYATVAVTVSPIPVTAITFEEEEIRLTVGQLRNLIPVIAPENATYQDVTLTSGNTSIVTVTNNKLLTAVDIGTTTVTVTAHNGVTATITVVVSPVTVTSVTVSKSKVDLKIGETEQIRVTVNPNNATDKTVTYTSSDSFVASVSENGLITAIGVGTATVTVSANDGSGKKATVTVTVTEPSRDPEPETPTQPSGNSGGSSFADAFRNFFAKIIELFRNLFKH